MSLTPVIYVDNETVIGATNLNAIQDAILANESAIASKVNTSDYNPSAKTSEMTQEVGKDINGKLWTNPSGGGGGAGLVIKGYYATLQALIQAVPNPSLGDAYGVGASAPYTIYIWDGSTWVNNGTIKGEKGDDGEDGYSPAVTITQTQGGHNVNITDKQHPSGQTFSVTNGIDGQDGQDGQDGDNGFSPIVSSTPITGGTRLTIQDATHTVTIDILNGSGTGDMRIEEYDPTEAVKTAGGIPNYVNTQGGKIDVIQVNGTPQTITNKTVNLTPSASDVAYGQTTVNAELSSQSSQIASLTNKVVSISLSSTWNGSASPFSQTVTISGETITSSTKVDLQPSSSVIAQLITDKVSGLYVENNNGTLTAYAIGNKPTVALTVQGTIYEVDV